MPPPANQSNNLRAPQAAIPRPIGEECEHGILNLAWLLTPALRRGLLDQPRPPLCFAQRSERRSDLDCSEERAWPTVSVQPDSPSDDDGDRSVAYREHRI